eukprot:TRINITY_DN3522_c0_g1_i1.p1 TRINITY_DN3522_c0_g1~~TRINITY_DN3522_c0_g1_i1.p1  ORF type:complete len:710 (+),score=87.48 TRINITY_DN3522_c0_g1_i1:60-2189(+)
MLHQPPQSEELQRVFSRIFVQTKDDGQYGYARGPSPLHTVPTLRASPVKHAGNEVIISWAGAKAERRSDGEAPQAAFGIDSLDDSDDSLTREREKQNQEAEDRRKKLQAAHQAYLDFLKKMQTEGKDQIQNPFHANVENPVEPILLPPRPTPPPLIDPVIQSPVHPNKAPTPPRILSPEKPASGMTLLEQEIQAIKCDQHLTALEKSRKLKAVLADYLQKKSAANSKPEPESHNNIEKGPEPIAPLAFMDLTPKQEQREWASPKSPQSLPSKPPNLRPTLQVNVTHPLSPVTQRPPSTSHRPASPPQEPASQQSIRRTSFGPKSTVTPKREIIFPVSPEREASSVDITSPIALSQAPQRHAASPQRNSTFAPSSILSEFSSLRGKEDLSHIGSDSDESASLTSDDDQSPVKTAHIETSIQPQEISWCLMSPDPVAINQGARQFTLGQALSQLVRRSPEEPPGRTKASNPLLVKPSVEASLSQVRPRMVTNKGRKQAVPAASSQIPAPTVNIVPTRGVVSQYRNHLAVVNDDTSSVNSFSDIHQQIPDDWFAPGHLDLPYTSPHPTEPPGIFDPLTLVAPERFLKSGPASLLDHSSILLECSLPSEKSGLRTSFSRSPSESSLEHYGDALEALSPDLQKEWIPQGAFENIDDDIPSSAFGEGYNKYDDFTTQTAREVLLLSPTNATRQRYRPPAQLLASLVDDLACSDSD